MRNQSYVTSENFTAEDILIKECVSSFISTHFITFTFVENQVAQFRSNFLILISIRVDGKYLLIITLSKCSSQLYVDETVMEY